MQHFNEVYVTGTYRSVRAPSGIIQLRRVPPMFPPAKWNVHEATLNNDARTNNICEGWNNKFSSLIGHKHPSVWTTIQGFQQDCSAVEVVIHQDAIGQPPAKRQRKKHVDVQKRLRNLCLDYNSGRKDMGQFLIGIAHNMRILGYCCMLYSRNEMMYSLKKIAVILSDVFNIHCIISTSVLILCAILN